MPSVRLAVAVAVVILAAPAAARAQDTSADVFVAAVMAFANADHPDDAWLSPQSPWAPYLDGQFADALDEADRALWRARQDVGECATVLTLEQQGFFNRYPDLARAFRDDTVRTVFETVIAPRHSVGHRRCTALREIIPVIEAAKRRALLIDGAFVSPLVIIWYDDPSFQPEASAAYREALIVLYRLALCRRYRPAIADVIEVEVDLQATQLSQYADIRWFEDIAESAGLDYEKVRERKNLLRVLFDSYTIWQVEGPYVERDAVGTPVSPPPKVAEFCRE